MDFGIQQYKIEINLEIAPPKKLFHAHSKKKKKKKKKIPTREIQRVISKIYFGILSHVCLSFYKQIICSPAILLTISQEIIV